MEITYGGGASFVLKCERMVVINGDRCKENAIYLFSERRPDRHQIVNGPGEYEIAGITITTSRAGINGDLLSHAVEMDGVRVLHVARMPALFDGDELTDLRSIDVLIVPAEDPEPALELIATLSPRIILPYGPGAAEICAILGMRDLQPQTRLTWNGTASIPRAALLQSSKARTRAA